MRRLQLLEIEDQAWCPASIRNALTDYLLFVLNAVRPYSAIAPQLRDLIERTGEMQVVDLCSGAGGPWPSLAAELRAGCRVRLTDLYPNRAAFERLREFSHGVVDYEPASVDATAVPRHLRGIRTMFSSFHHFPPAIARLILEDAVRSGQAIAVVEATERKWGVLAAMLLVPLFVLLVTPAIRPFRWSCLFWTYVLPAVPLFALFDGVVSCLRTYTPAELVDLTTGLDGFVWEIGTLKIPRSAAALTYLFGRPNGT